MLWKLINHISRIKFYKFYIILYYLQSVEELIDYLWAVRMQHFILDLEKRMKLAQIFCPVKNILFCILRMFCIECYRLSYYEKHVLLESSQIYYWTYKCTTCHYYTNIIKNSLIKLIKTRNYLQNVEGTSLIKCSLR
jgi:hypothetical protein